MLDPSLNSIALHIGPILDWSNPGLVQSSDAQQGIYLVLPDTKVDRMPILLNRRGNIIYYLVKGTGTLSPLVN